MAGRRSSHGAGEGLSSLARRPVDESELREAVANLATVDLAGLRLQWRNVFGGTAPVHLPKPLLARILAYQLQADAFGDLPGTVRRTLEGFGAQSSAPSGQTRGNGSSYRRRIKPGSILVREWNGRLQRVTALEEGVRLGGQDLPQPLNGRPGHYWWSLERAEVFRPPRIQGDGASGSGDHVH
jgi:hypothetical protein